MKLTYLLMGLVLFALTGCVNGKQELWLYADGTAQMYQELVVAKEIATKPDFKPPFEDYHRPDATIRNLKLGQFSESGKVYYFAKFDIVDVAKFAQSSPKARSIAPMRVQYQGDGRILLTQTFSPPAPMSKDSEDNMRLLLAGEYLTMIVHAPYVVQTNGTTFADDNGAAVQWKLPMEDVLIDGVSAPLSVEYSLTKPAQGRVYFRNECGKPIRLALGYKDQAGDWQHKRWWKFERYENSYLISNGQYISSNNSYFYLYAETTDSSNLVWKGDNYLKFDGTTLGTHELHLEPDADGDWIVSVRCDS